MNYKIGIVLCISSILFTGCTDFMSIPKNKVVVEKIKASDSLIDVQKEDLLTKEEAQQKAVDFLKSCYDITLDDKNFKTRIRLIDNNITNDLSDDINIQSYLELQMNFDLSKLNTHYYSVEFDNKNKTSYGTNLPRFGFLNIDARNGEVVWFYRSRYKNKKNITLSRSEAKQVADDFLKKNYLLRMDTIELKSSNFEDYSSYYFLYENHIHPNETFYLSVPKDEKIVRTFSKGIYAMIHSILDNM